MGVCGVGGVDLGVFTGCGGCGCCIGAARGAGGSGSEVVRRCRVVVAGAAAAPGRWVGSWQPRGEAFEMSEEGDADSWIRVLMFRSNR